jgi:O-antigen ligase
MLGWGLLAFTSAVGIALTLSRGAFVGAIVGSVALVYVRGISRKASVLLVVTLAAVLVAAVATGAVTRAASVLDFRSDPSSMDRIYLSEASVKMFVGHPATGVGVAGFQAAYPRYRDPRVVVEPVLEGHQMVFSIPAELGVLGLVSEILIGGSLLYAVFGLRRRDGIEGVAFVGLVASVAYGAMAFFNTLQYLAPFWLALAWADSLMLESGFLTRSVRGVRTPVVEIER